MLEIIQSNVIEVVSTTIVTVAVGILVGIVRKLRWLFVGVRADLKDKIIRFGEFYILTNQITIEELENLTELYKAYAGLKGNGTTKEVYERCRELPIVDERTEFNPYYTERKKRISK